MTTDSKLQPGQRVAIDYTNYRGERSVRVVIPVEGGNRFGSTEFHPEPQWLLEAHDVEKNALRTFAMRDIHSFTPVPDGTAPAQAPEPGMRRALLRGAAVIVLRGMQSERAVVCALRGDDPKRDPVTLQCAALKAAIRDGLPATTDNERLLALLDDAREELGVSKDEWLTLVPITAKPDTTGEQQLAWGVPGKP